MSRRLTGALAGLVVIGVALAGSITATPAIAATGTPVYSESGISPAYPRVVRTADGNLLSTEGRNTVNPNQTAQPFLFQRSTNDGASWSALGSISDYHGLTVSQLLAPSLYVLPQAAGAYPAGTVFLGLTYKASTASVGGVQVFRSSDNGATWTWHSQTALNKFEDTWEPEFILDSSGRLVVFYSEEGIAGYSQVLSREISTDGGLTWGSHQIIVGSTGSWRPGMARVVKLKNGSYLLAYESIADIGNQGNGIVRIKMSTDGDTFGTPSDPGAAVMSGIEATPGLGYNPLDGPNGRLVASGWRGGTATSTDNGATWSLISDIVEHGTAGDDAVGFSPSYVAVGSTGLLEMEVTGDVPGEPNRTEVRAAIRTFPVRDDFQDSNDAGWIRYGGTWTVTGGAYDVASSASGKSLTGRPQRATTPSKPTFGG